LGGFPGLPRLSSDPNEFPLRTRFLGQLRHRCRSHRAITRWLPTNCQGVSQI
jgi:hypothetical protein